MFDYFHKQGNTPFHWAAEKGYEEIIKLLLELKEVTDNINIQNEVTFRTNFLQFYFKILLLQDSMTPLMLASKNGHIDIVKALLAVPDVDINMQDEVRKLVIVD